MDLWRWWAGFAALGSAVVSACLGDWAWAAVAGGVVLLLLARWFRGQMAATRRSATPAMSGSTGASNDTITPRRCFHPGVAAPSR